MKVAQLYLVSCVGKKQDAPTAARDLYVSPWFKKARAYVEAHKAPWFIFSAEYGLVDPDEVIPPYEKTLNEMGARDRGQWASMVVRQMEDRMPDAVTLVVLAGFRYREYLMDYLSTRADRLEVPLQGMGIGQQLQWLNEATSP